MMALVAASLSVPGPHPAAAQAGVEIEYEEPEIRFGEQVLFRGALKTDRPVREALLLAQSGTSGEVQVIPAKQAGQGHLEATLDVREHPLRPFSQVTYQFQITFEDGVTQDGPLASFNYTDNRFDWRQLRSSPFRVHWYQAGPEFGQQVLNVGQAGLQQAQEILPQAIGPPEIDVYVYNNSGDLRTALAGSGQEWLAGHADAELGLIMVSLAPGPEQRLEMERQIPHELMHLMMAYTDANTYRNLPAWLNEGLASLAELYPNPDYPLVLQNAYQSGELIPMAALCKAIPADSGRALLAYAQSASFVRFLIDAYPGRALESLLAFYAQGQGCEEAIQAGLGASLAQLDARWQRQTFAAPSLRTAFAELLPWLLLLLLVLVGPAILMVRSLRRTPARSEL